MAAFALFSFLCGAVLAFRFRVMVLYPIIAIGATIGVILGVSAGKSLWTVALGVVTVAVSFQLGYLFGTVGRASLIAARVSARRRRREDAAKLPPQPI